MYVFAVPWKHFVLNVCTRLASCEPKWATYNPWGFGALSGIVGKAATVTSGDCVWLLVTEAHGVHRLASAADDPLQREMRRHRESVDPLWERVGMFDKRFFWLQRPGALLQVRTSGGPPMMHWAPFLALLFSLSLYGRDIIAVIDFVFVFFLVAGNRRDVTASRLLCLVCPSGFRGG